MSLDYVSKQRQYICIEIDFPATMDEDFQITTSKQQGDLSNRMWDILEDAGLNAAINNMRKDWSKLNALSKTEKEDPITTRPSEKAAKIMDDISRDAKPDPLRNNRRRKKRKWTIL